MQNLKMRTVTKLLSRAYTTSSPSVLVIGGDGALGRAVVNSFQRQGLGVLSVDFTSNHSASSNRLLSSRQSWRANTQDLLEHVKSQNLKFDSIVNVAGRWLGDNASTESIMASFDVMIDVNLKTALSAAHLASVSLKEGGLLVLTGALPVYKGGTGYMLSYGTSKAAVHHMVKSLAEPSSSGLPKNARTICILPSTIDTPSNRVAMPTADFSGWTRPEIIADCLVHWSRESSGVF